MNELAIFNNQEFASVRVINVNCEPWFVGKDVCNFFGDTNYRRSISNVDSEDKMTSQVKTNGGMQNMILINESGLYSLLFQMQPQKAKGVSQNEQHINERIEKIRRFKHWVTSEVLPQIRKTGSYASPQLTGEELMAKALIEANSVLARQSKQLEEQKPKVLFADSVIASKNSILIRELAKLIKQNGYDIGEKKLYRWLREKGYICKNSTEPTQMAMNLGLFEIVVRTIERGDAPPRATRTTKVTGKGQVYFINKLCNSNCSLYDLEPLF